jgi:hypothetical protein
VGGQRRKVLQTGRGIADQRFAIAADTQTL